MNTRPELLTRALLLAIIAPTEEQAKRAAELAEDVAQGLSANQVETAKRAAIQLARHIRGD